MQRWDPSTPRGPGQTRAPYTGPIFDLLVLEGDDAGQQFTVDAPEVALGHSRPRDPEAEAIVLHDATVSSQQAVIRMTDQGMQIEHRPRATNPTLVNGQPISVQPLTMDVWSKMSALTPLSTVDWGFYSHPMSPARSLELRATVEEIEAKQKAGEPLEPRAR